MSEKKLNINVENSDAAIYVDTHRPRVRYSRMLFGQFLEHFHRQVYGGIFEPGSPLSDEHGFRLDVVEALRELRVPVVRWPGGCFVSAYHWAHGIGPNRRPEYDKAWRVEDPNTFGTDEFVTWCRMIGAEPYICTNGGTGSSQEMSDWVEYCNLAEVGRWAKMRLASGFREPHRVNYWSIGNENYGDWEMGAKSAVEWGRFVAESAKMMKRVDPTIKLYAAALPDLDWTLTLLRAAGQYLDCVSIHGYWDGLWQNNQPSSYSTCMMRALQPEAAVRMTENVIAVAGFEGRIGIAFDEWNLRGWHHPLTDDWPADIASRDKNDINATYSMADAIFSAGFLNSCLRHASTVRMANMAPVVNTRGPLFVHSRGIVMRTTYHVLWMYANLLGNEVCDAYVDCAMMCEGDSKVPVVDAVVTHDGAHGQYHAVLVNRHADRAVTCMMMSDGVKLNGSFAATQLSGDSTEAYNDIDQPDRVFPVATQIAFADGQVVIPPHSITSVTIT